MGFRAAQWLQAHGARFDKLAWPTITASGLRGATASAPIATGEPMLEIPSQLLISEATCAADPVLGPIFKANADVFARDDPVLALFLMRELARGPASFYAPYLEILPEVVTIQDWRPDELIALRDPTLVEAALRRQTEMEATYRRMMRRLDDKHPGQFPRAEYTFERFRFAWKTIQARTFGRRLPWTALVPFADCLNHANVATKYDFDVDGNGRFRLFPSGANHYDAGVEAFNSYGRRPNDQLLLDYGFVLPDNEWDYVIIELPLEGRRQYLGPQFPHKRRIRLDRQTPLEMIFPPALFATDEAVTTEMEEPTRPNRRRALDWFRSLLVRHLEEYDTTIADDLMLLREDIPQRLRAAIVYRLSRMRIVDDYMKEIDDDMKSVCSATHDATQLVAKLAIA